MVGTAEQETMPFVRQCESDALGPTSRRTVGQDERAPRGLNIGTFQRDAISNSIAKVQGENLIEGNRDRAGTRHSGNDKSFSQEGENLPTEEVNESKTPYGFKCSPPTINRGFTTESEKRPKPISLATPRLACKFHYYENREESTSKAGNDDVVALTSRLSKEDGKIEKSTDAVGDGAPSNPVRAIPDLARTCHNSEERKESAPKGGEDGAVSFTVQSSEVGGSIQKSTAPLDDVVASNQSGFTATQTHQMSSLETDSKKLSHDSSKPFTGKCKHGAIEAENKVKNYKRGRTSKTSQNYHCSTVGRPRKAETRKRGRQERIQKRKRRHSNSGVSGGLSNKRPRTQSSTKPRHETQQVTIPKGQLIVDDSDNPMSSSKAGQPNEQKILNEQGLGARRKKTTRRTKRTAFSSRNIYTVMRKKKRYVTKILHTKHLPVSPEQTTAISDSQVILDKVYIEENPEIKSTQPPTREVDRPRQVASDGRISDAIGDPPGQQSIYIIPGDVRRESYRLSTFEHFPVVCPISRKSLAKSGFYFTGYFDRVKCFACGRTVESWVVNDDPTDRRWHKPDCPLPRGEPCGNIPVQELFSRLRFNGQNTEHGQTSQRRGATQNTTTVRYPQDVASTTNPGGNIQVNQGSSVNIQTRPSPRPNPPTYGSLPSAAPQAQRWRMANVVSADHRRFLMNLYLNRELDRLASFARWSMSRPNVSPAALAKSGFFYLGDMDRTQCFSCGGVLRNWTIEDEAEEEHRTHFPTCRMVQGLETRNVPIPQQNETPEERLSLYPCRFSASPHMRNEATRRDTFQHGWPYGSTSATPAAIAQGGFFYLGERDRVKCWYCNGGLQNWEYDDDPWEEHAKWFPNCQFLLQTKGQNFVYRHLSANPHLARPIIAKQEGSTIDSEPGEARGYDIPPSEIRNVTQPIESPTIIDPREEIRKKKERIDGIVRNSEIVRNVIAMGFSEQVVRSLLEERIDSGQEANSNGIFGSVSDLLDAVMAREAEDMNVEESNQASLSTNATGPSMNPSSLTSSLGPPAASGSYNVSFTGEDERMDDREPGSVASPQLPGSGQESLEEQLRKIEEERMCKICFTNMADMVYVPCGHMCCCVECTKAINKCPMCRKKIDKAIKTYVT